MESFTISFDDFTHLFPFKKVSFGAIFILFLIFFHYDILYPTYQAFLQVKAKVTPT